MSLDAQALPMRAADSPQNAPGWRVLGDTPTFTLVYPPGRAPSREVVNALHEICPDLIPMWMAEKWIPPDSTEPVLLGWHCLGRWVWNPQGPRALFHVRTPADWKGKTPNLLEVAIQGPDWPDGSPPVYEPLDWKQVGVLRAKFLKRPLKEVIPQVLAENRLHRARAVMHAKLEEKYKRADIDKWISKRLDEASIDEWNEGIDQYKRKAARRKEGVYLGDS